MFCGKHHHHHHHHHRLSKKRGEESSSWWTEEKESSFLFPPASAASTATLLPHIARLEAQGISHPAMLRLPRGDARFVFRSHVQGLSIRLVRIWTQG